MFKKVVLVFVLLLFLLNYAPTQQYQEVPPQHFNEYGLGITLAMSGFGLGGFYRVAFPNFFHVGASLDFYMMNDENEFNY
jgi:hypothetical protein